MLAAALAQGACIISGVMGRVAKLAAVAAAGERRWVRALCYGVAAGVEHRHLLRHLNCRTVVDIGANRGQFALAARAGCPTARLVAFEPLPKPAAVFRSVFAGDSRTALHEAAIGPVDESGIMHVSARDDSSSLLPISSLQAEMFPGTEEVGTMTVRVAPLATFLREDDILEPALLKIDVQGYELDALRGCESLLAKFKWVYCECSFVELYTGQKLAGDVIGWLSRKGYEVAGVFNAAYDRKGRAVQADLLFEHGRPTSGSDPARLPDQVRR